VIYLLSFASRIRREFITKPPSPVLFEYMLDVLLQVANDRYVVVIDVSWSTFSRLAKAIILPYVRQLRERLYARFRKTFSFSITYHVVLFKRSGRME
jgi:hypothetical protein